jgi:hypothetical protein
MGRARLLSLLALASLARAQDPASLADVQTLQIAKDLHPVAATCADIDGDGAREVLVAVRSGGKKDTRAIEIWHVGKDGHLALAETLPLTPDVIAWAVGDVSTTPGDEVVLFNATGVFAWHSSGAPEQRYERLCTADFLWQLPEQADVPLLQNCLRDVDGDGSPDLVLPEPGGYRIVVQRRARTVDASGAPAAWGIENRLRLPDETDAAGLWVTTPGGDAPARRNRRRERAVSFSLSSRDDDDDQKPSPILVQLNESVPAPSFIDWDGDGDLDLLAQMTHHMVVWKQEPRGQFAAAPTLSLPLPVDADRARLLDASYSSHAVDLDGDKRADCVVFAGDQRSDDVRTQGMFFYQGGFAQNGKDPAAPLFGEGGKPRDVLVFAGFITNPVFADIDGDGLPDLTLRAVRPDLIDQLRSASSRSIEADLFVYRNVKGTFPRQPDLVWHHTIPIERFELSSEFLGDLTGDGISELFVRSDPKELRVLLVRKLPGKGTALTVFDKPLWTLAIDEDAKVEPLPVAPRAKPQLLILESAQVLYVRFK